VATADLLNDALYVVLQFGPERSRPVGERLGERHPDVSEAELQAALEVSRSAEALAYQLTSSCWPRGAVSDLQIKQITTAAERELREAFPGWLTNTSGTW